MEPEKPTTSAKFILKKLPKTISRSNDRDVSLPSPFPLPQNYRADVAAALEETRLVFAQTVTFLFFLVFGVLQYKLVVHDYKN